MRQTMRHKERRGAGLAGILAATAPWSWGTAPAGASQDQQPPAEPAPVGTGMVFLVELDPGMQAPARDGRVVVYLIRPDSSIPERTPPAMAPFFSDPQPVYGVDVKGFGPGDMVRVDDAASVGFPGRTSELEAGEYRVQAVFDWQSESGSWYREPGNVFSAVVTATKGDGGGVVVPVTLTNRVPAPPEPSVAGGQFFEVRSEMLSAFRGRDVFLRAGVALPIDHDPLSEYPAIYEIPGFGGDRSSALREAQRRRTFEAGSEQEVLARSAFRIVIDPDGPNGHTLLADSANNGPVGQAIVEELIPALERRYRLIASPEARLVTGHSSGGWTTLWLMTEYPEVFGAGWSSAPDPVDFHAFQRVDIYNDANMYYRQTPEGERVALASYTRDGKVLMTIAEENAVENAIGPRNTSGEQWDSWLAVFGARADDGNPADLFDTASGSIHREAGEHFRRYDIVSRLRSDPERFGPIFRDRIRLVVGDADSFDLHIAVERLKVALGEVWPKVTMEMTPGYIEIVPGADHGSVLRSEIVSGWDGEMIQHLRRSGLEIQGPGEGQGDGDADGAGER